MLLNTDKTLTLKVVYIYGHKKWVKIKFTIFAENQTYVRPCIKHVFNETQWSTVSITVLRYSLKLTKIKKAITKCNLSGLSDKKNPSFALEVKNNVDASARGH